MKFKAFLLDQCALLLRGRHKPVIAAARILVLARNLPLVIHVEG